GAGVIREPAVHRQVLRDLLAWLANETTNPPDATGERLLPHGLVASPITGRDGNHEYLLLLRLAPGQERATVDEQTIERVVQEAFAATT
ncbi:MAG TPA: hypothetical protein VFQ32_10450, partial [Ktedonobacterales bacterium]|nr:hypothetical protein [Ktedonobacterales bacterium]